MKYLSIFITFSLNLFELLKRRRDEYGTITFTRAAEEEEEEGGATETPSRVSFQAHRQRAGLRLPLEEAARRTHSVRLHKRGRCV